MKRIANNKQVTSELDWIESNWFYLIPSPLLADRIQHFLSTTISIWGRRCWATEASRSAGDANRKPPARNMLSKSCHAVSIAPKKLIYCAPVRVIPTSCVFKTSSMTRYTLSQHASFIRFILIIFFFRKGHVLLIHSQCFPFSKPKNLWEGVGEREGGGILCETDAMKWRLFWFVRYRHTLTSSWNCWRVVSCCSVSGSSNTSPKRKPPAFGRNCSPVSVTFIRKESFIAISNPRYIIIHHALPLIRHHNHLWNLLKPRLLPVLLFNVLCK